jgi:hypothetical protein
MTKGTEMADEPTLRHLFGEPPPAAAIDVSSVIRRSRARRAPRILGTGALAVLAATTIAYAGFAGLAGFNGATSSDAGGAAPMAESGVAGEEKDYSSQSLSSAVSDLYRCGEPVFDIPQNELGLVLSVDFPSPVDVAASSIDGVVTVTNTGNDAVVVIASSAPALALTADDLVVWRAEAGLSTLSLDLAPGETFTWDTSFSPLSCGPDDGPTLSAGDYELHAAIDVGTEDGQIPGRPWASGPSQSLILR